MPKQIFQFESIGWVESPFKDRFAVPRQPGLAPVKGVIHLHDREDLRLAIKDLSQFSHIWVLFVFHEHGSHAWKPSIRPPRLGGKQKVGVLSSRSPHRPNPIGMSVFPVSHIDEVKGKIYISGLDVIDGTPVLDIKPYIPYADSYPEASAGWASEEIPTFAVTWSEAALVVLAQLQMQRLQEADSDATDEKKQIDLKTEIESILEIDPRPAFQKRKNPVGLQQSCGLRYGFDVRNIDVKYELAEHGFHIYQVKKLD